MQRNHVFLLVCLLIATPLVAQPVELPSLSIDGSYITSKVTFDASRGVYRYQYGLVSSAANKTDIDGFRIDLTGRIVRPQLDPDLVNNVERPESAGEVWQPSTTIPAGLVVPDPATWDAGIGEPAWAWFTHRFEGARPGSTSSGFIVESKLPPGLRKAWIDPSELPWIRITLSSPPGTEFHPDSAEVFEIETEVIGPTDIDETTLFLGGGQSPKEVNPFLRYAAPTEARTNLAAGTSSYCVIVFYGSTIDPSTLAAEINRSSVTSLFHPIPGAAEVVTIPLAPGTNKLQLSVEGTTSSGRTARDTDTLTFLVD